MNFTALKVAILSPVIALFLLLSIFTASLQSMPLQESNNDEAAVPVVVPLKGDKGESTPIDYQKVQSLVQQEVANQINALPKPVNGLDGKNGSNGKDGAAGQQGVVGDQGPQGVQGDIGPAGQQIELHINPVTNNLECRFAGDTIWIVITGSGGVCP